MDTARLKKEMLLCFCLTCEGDHTSKLYTFLLLLLPLGVCEALSIRWMAGRWVFCLFPFFIRCWIAAAL